MDTDTAAQILKRLLVHLDERTTDYATSVMTMDVTRYFDDQTAADERDLVFAALPAIAAHSSELRESGDFVTKDCLGTPVLLIRQDDGTVGAFTNVCRHRGARLELQTSGNRKLFSCRYHQWCYRRDGGLQAIPFPDGFAEVDRSRHGLVALPVDERHGLIWTVPTPGAELDITDYIGPQISHELDVSGIGSAVLFREQVFELTMNWKFVMDGFLDTYHLQFLHPDTVGPFFHTNVHAFDGFEENSRLSVARKTIDSLRGRELSAINPNNYIITNYMIFPATLLVTEPAHFETWTILPHPTRADRCQVTLRFLVQHQPETEEERRLQERNWDLLIRAAQYEDWDVAKSIGDNLPRSHVAQTVYGRNEIQAQHFYNQLERRLQRRATSLAGYGTEDRP